MITRTTHGRASVTLPLAEKKKEEKDKDIHIRRFPFREKGEERDQIHKYSRKIQSLNFARAGTEAQHLSEFS